MTSSGRDGSGAAFWAVWEVGEAAMGRRRGWKEGCRSGAGRGQIILREVDGRVAPVSRRARAGRAAPAEPHWRWSEIGEARPGAGMLLRTTERGLYCEAGDFYVDPWLPVDAAVITHAHGDHARWGSERYLGARQGERVMRT